MPQVITESVLKFRLRLMIPGLSIEEIDTLTYEIKDLVDLDGQKINEESLDVVVEMILDKVKIGDKRLFQFEVGSDNLRELLVQK